MGDRCSSDELPAHGGERHGGPQRRQPAPDGPLPYWLRGCGPGCIRSSTWLVRHRAGVRDHAYSVHQLYSAVNWSCGTASIMTRSNWVPRPARNAGRRCVQDSGGRRRAQISRPPPRVRKLPRWPGMPRAQAQIFVGGAVVGRSHIRGKRQTHLDGWPRFRWPRTEWRIARPRPDRRERPHTTHHAPPRPQRSPGSPAPCADSHDLPSHCLLVSISNAERSG